MSVSSGRGERLISFQNVLDIKTGRDTVFVQFSFEHGWMVFLDNSQPVNSSIYAASRHRLET